jgi:two-component system response regulator WspF
VRIAVANDSWTAVDALRRVIAADSAHTLIWVARDGVEAVEACGRDVPDLLLMDLMMPRLNGVEATRRIMAASPCAIVIVAGDVGHRSHLVYEAMGYGALDVVEVPLVGRHDAAPLRAKIETICRLVGAGPAALDPRALRPVVPAALPGETLIAIGASAGGPAAIATILAAMPEDLPATIVVVQHVDNAFVDGMARWLAGCTKLSVRIAREGDRPKPGSVSLAATTGHLEFDDDGRLGYRAFPEPDIYRPGIDVLFESVCRSWRGRAVGVLLTGMGRDGARGLKMLRDCGHNTIAQDESTSAVYGMPKSAASLAAAVDILPLPLIAQRLIDLSRVRLAHGVFE